MKDQKGSSSGGLSVGMCLGLAAGVGIGSATRNLGLWMPLGLSVGMCFGLALTHRGEVAPAKDEAAEAPEEDEESDPSSSPEN